MTLKRYSAAASELEEAYSIFSEALGDGHKRTRDLLPHLVSCYDAWHEAEPGADHDKIADHAMSQRIVEAFQLDAEIAA